jgi:hypothetical protein
MKVDCIPFIIIFVLGSYFVGLLIKNLFSNLAIFNPQRYNSKRLAWIAHMAILALGAFFLKIAFLIIDYFKLK